MKSLKKSVKSEKNPFFLFPYFSGTNLHKDTYNTIFERYIFPLFKNLSGTDVLVILVELWYEMFWNFFLARLYVQYRKLSQISNFLL